MDPMFAMNLAMYTRGPIKVRVDSLSQPKRVSLIVESLPLLPDDLSPQNARRIGHASLLTKQLMYLWLNFAFRKCRHIYFPKFSSTDTDTCVNPKTRVIASPVELLGELYSVPGDL
jgi:hypothetical protein